MKPSKKVTVGGQVIEVTSVSGFAYMGGKSVCTIKRYERQEILPGAVLYIDDVRYYPVNFVRKIAPLIAKIPGNVKCPAELRVELNRLFAEERSKYASN